MALTAEQVTIIRSGLDASAYQAGADIMVAANRNIAASAAPVVQSQAAIMQSQTATTRSLVDGGSAFDRYRQRIDANYQAIQKFGQIQQVANRAVQAGRTDIETANTVLSAYAAKFGLVSAAAQEATRRTEAAAQAARTMASAQASINAATGVREPTGGEDYAKRAADIHAYGASLDQLRAKYNPLFAASKAYEAELHEIAKAEKMGAISSVEGAAARDRLNKTFAEQTGTARALGLAGEAAAESADNMDKLAHGSAGVTREFLIMGHELTMGNWNRLGGSLEVMLERTGSLRGMAQATGQIFQRLWAFVTTPIGLAVGGFLAAGAAVAAITIPAERADRALLQLQNRLHPLRDDFQAAAREVEAIAHHLAKTTTLSFAESFEAAGSLAGNQELRGASRAQMESMVKLAQSMAQSFPGMDMPKATAMLTEGLRDAAKVAQKMLDDRLIDGIDQRWVEMVKDMEARDPSRAFEMLRQKLDAATDGAPARLTALQKAWADFEKEVTGGGRGIGQSIGETFGAALAGLLNQVTLLIASTKTLLDLLLKAKVSAPAPYAPTPGQSWPSFLWDMTDEHKLAGYLTTPQAGLGDRGAATLGGRLNNPMNLTALPGEQAVGRFRQFPSMEEGIAASVRQLQINEQQHHLLTLEAQVKRWAPSNENDTEAYITYMQQALGEPGKPLERTARIDTANTDLMQRWVAAATKRETGMTLAPDMLERGVALGLSPAGATTPPGVDISHGIEGSKDTTIYRGREIERQIATENRALTALQGDQEKARQEGRYDQWQRDVGQLEEKLRKLNSALTDNISEQQKSARAASDANAANGAQAGGARELAKVQQDAARLARDTNGGVIDQAALTTRLTEKQRELNTAVNDNVDLTRRQAAGLERQIPAMEQGGAAADHAANAERARLEALKTADTTTADYERQVRALTAAYDGETRAKREAETATNIHRMSQESDQLRLEIALLGQSNDLRERALAILKERQRQGLAGGEEARTPTGRTAIRQAAEVADLRSSEQHGEALHRMDQESQTLALQLKLLTDTTAARGRELAILRERQAMDLAPDARPTPMQQSRLDRAGDLADQQARLQNAERDLHELESVSDRALQTMAAAIETPLRQGETAAQRFREAMVSVIDDIMKELMKLAVFNPLMNGLFGGDRPTLGGVGGLLGKLWGGGESDAGGGAGSGSGRGGSGAPGGGGGIGGLLGKLAGSAGGSGGPMGSLVDKIGGEGFYAHGGLLGSWFGGPAASAFNALPEGMAGPVLDASASGGMLSGIGDWFSGLFHDGGVVGLDGTGRLVSAHLFDTAPRYHAGLGADEFAAILQRGERVLTANQNNRLEGVLRGGDNDANAPRQSSGGNSVVFNIQTPNADSFRASQPQIQARAAASLGRTQRRNAP